MVGFRTYTTLAPNHWRFPEWKNGIYYPAGSYVAVSQPSALDSEAVTISYWVTTQDVKADNKLTSLGTLDSEGGSWAPNDSDSDWANSIYGGNPWILTFDTTAAAISTSLIAQVTALAPLLSLLGVDSDVGLLKSRDSDILIRLANLDSDLLQEIHDGLGQDSDLRTLITNNDSDILMEIHDRRAADSDYDSEIRRMLDSEVHDRKAADSDLQIQIYDNDSDILMEIHDRIGADSDLLVIVNDKDSEIRREHDSDLRLIRRDIDSDSDRLTNFIKRYTDRDSDITVKLQNLDSDIQNFNIGPSGTPSQQSTGFPVGTIQAFATTEMPVGFRLCDGTQFNATTYPDLFQMLGQNVLPDLRNQFLRGWNNDSDGFGNVRGLLSKQDDQFEAHSHDYQDNFTTSQNYITGGPTGAPRNPTDQTRTTTTVGGDETRPTNVSVAYGIAMYSGAGVVYDSEIIESIVRIVISDRDSDIQRLLNRTNFYEESFVADSDYPYLWKFTPSIDVNLFDDITVLLNGVQVTQWTRVNSEFTFQFAMRKDVDSLYFKLRR